MIVLRWALVLLPFIFAIIRTLEDMTETPCRFKSLHWFRSLRRHARQAVRDRAGRGVPDDRQPGRAAHRRGPEPGELHSHPLDQSVRLAPAQPIGEFTCIPGTVPATLPVLPPQQAALEQRFVGVTRDAADDRTPAATGELAAAALAMRQREA